MALAVIAAPIPYVRVLAALSLPPDLDASFNAPVAALANERSLPLQLAFCQAAGDSHMPYVGKVLKILDTTQNRYIFFIAYRAALNWRRKRSGVRSPGRLTR